MDVQTAPADKNHLERLRELADSFDCLTEADVMLVGDVSAATVEAWRKRGTGPAYILFGNTFLYPRKPFASFLQTKLRERNAAPGKAFL